MYSDASWGDREVRKSTTGYAVYLHGALIMWKSLKQTHVPTSTCEAEYSAICDCEIQLEWLQQLIKDLNMKWVKPVTVFCDNTAAQQLAGNQGVKTLSKHINIRYNNVRVAVSNGFIKLEHCASECNIAEHVHHVHQMHRLSLCISGFHWDLSLQSKEEC